MRLGRPLQLLLVAAVLLLLIWGSTRLGGQDDGTSGTSTGSTTVGSRTSGATSTRSSTHAPSSAARTSPVPSAAGSTDGTTPRGTDTRDWDDVDACAAGSLPPQLAPVVADVEAGGPYEHPGKDGSTFGNYEGVLPDESRGYYREYTVDTPGASTRGARRVITGGGRTHPEVWYYTEDHYGSFCEFAP